MNKWEYFFYTVRNTEFSNQNQDSPLANIPKFGDEGWELVSIAVYPGSSTMFAFKRPKEE